MLTSSCCKVVSALLQKFQWWNLQVYRQESPPSTGLSGLWVGLKVGFGLCVVGLGIGQDWSSSTRNSFETEKKFV